MKKSILLFLNAAALLWAQPTMILTPSQITVLKARAAANTAEWQLLRSTGGVGCDALVTYTAGTPDHLLPIYASGENQSDGGIGFRIGTDGNNYQGTAAMVAGMPAAVCYLILKDGDVTPAGWSYTWNGIRLTPQQYGILAGIQALKILNKTTPSFVKITPVTAPTNWGGFTWRMVHGAYFARMGRYGTASMTFGTVDANVENAVTSAATPAGSNLLHFSNTNDLVGNAVFTVGHVAIGTNIPAGTTVVSVVVNTSVTLSANVTGSGVASGAVIADTPSGNNCSAAGQAPVFMGLTQNGHVDLAAHTPVVLSNLLGPLGIALNGNTYYISATNNVYGYYLDTTAGGGTFVCAAPNQGTDYEGHIIGSGENYNHNPQADNEYPDRFFLSGMALLYDWLHPLLNQTPAAAINQLAALESTAVRNTFSGYPWTQTTYPQAIPTSYPTLQAQALDTIDAWTRDLFFGYYSVNDVGSFVQINNYFWGHYSGLALSAIAACHGSSGCASPDDARAPVWYDYWRNHYHLLVAQPYTARWYGPNGNMMDAWNYLPTTVNGVAMALIANYTAMGDDLVNNAAQPFQWIAGLEYYKHNLEPNGLSMLTRGYSGGGGVPPCVNCVTTQDMLPLQYLADIENLPLKNQFRSFLQQQINLSGEGEAGGNASVPFLFWDPNATQTSWASEPTVLGNMANPAGGYGHVYMRSDWTRSAVYGTFEARPYVFDFGNTKDALEGPGSLLVQRGMNHLLVEPMAECARMNPPTTTGAGAAMYAATTECNALLYYYTVHYGGGYYWVDNTLGTPTTSALPPATVVLSTSALSSASPTLTFTSTTGVAPGMTAIAASGIPGNAYVLGVTATTVTLNQNATVSSGASITFAVLESNSLGVGVAGTKCGAPGGCQGGNAHFYQPGFEQHNPPVCTGVGSPYLPGPAYTVSGSTVTVTPNAPLTSGWANGLPITFSWASGATPPKYYWPTGQTSATESIQRGVAYLIINWNSGGTFGIIKAPTNIGNSGSYPTTGTALTFVTAGSGTNIAHAGTCNAAGWITGVIESHPTRVDLLESTSNYAYARGIGLEGVYGGDPAVVGSGRVIANQREVLYLTPKLFLVYDRTRQAHWNQQALSFTSILDADGTNPIRLVTSTANNFHSGMQVKLTSVAGTGCSSLNNQTYTITALDGLRFGLNGQTTALGVSACTGMATGNFWGHQIISWHTGAVPTEVTTSGQITAGMRQWHVKAPAVSIASIGNTTPVTLVTSAPHYLNTGFTINVAGVTGACSALNGTWTVTIPTTGTATDLTKMTLNTSTACGTGTVGSATIQKFNGAITTILPKTPAAALSDMVLMLQGLSGTGTLGQGYVYRLMVNDPRDCTSNPSWCLASGADTADSQNWLTALDASVSAADTAILTPLTSTNADMVQVGSGTVAGFQNAQVTAGNCANGTCTAPAPVIPISYSFTQGTGAVNHYLAGVTPGATYYVNTSTPGSVTISGTGNAGATQASANGILSFVTPNGAGTTVTTISGPVQIKGSGSIQ